MCVCVRLCLIYGFLTSLEPEWVESEDYYGVTFWAIIVLFLLFYRGRPQIIDFCRFLCKTTNRTDYTVNYNTTPQLNQLTSYLKHVDRLN